MASATPPRGQAGTLGYMAPEMLLGKRDYAELVDAWSFGCVMAELHAGKPLFPDHSATDQLVRISRVRELFPEERLSHDPGSSPAPPASVCRRPWRAPMPVVRSHHQRAGFCCVGCVLYHIRKMICL
ncbi:hypothetical protein ZWY2020_001524 [Hordeum vulgare]|nr:hypothetical protein ZWY2020_001524 [Hordeum vulgare]